jgi:hypothetical protein
MPKPVCLSHNVIENRSSLPSQRQDGKIFSDSKTFELMEQILLRKYHPLDVKRAHKMEKNID